MTLEFIKHDRTVTPEDMRVYGKYATHDIKVPILLAYELGQINDKNGTPVNVDKTFIKKVMTATNNHIKARTNSPFARLKSWLLKPAEELEAIPLIKNHKTDDVDSVMGYSQGMLYLEEVEGVLGLFVKGLIQDPESKKRLDNKLLRATSIGTRTDGSIKEISFVVNPAMPHGGPIFSEQDSQKEQKEDDNSTTDVPVQLSDEQVQLMEEITDLEFQEAELSEVIIPNHLLLSRLIKTGKLQPWKYEKLINTRNTEALELMEGSMVGSDLGIMIGTYKPPSDLKASEDVLIDTIVNKYKEKSGKDEKSQAVNSEVVTKPAVTDSMISHGVSFEEMRKKELRNILELIEYSPEVADKYIKVELGEPVEAPSYNDKYLNEYLQKRKELKDKIATLKLQLGETQ